MKSGREPVGCKIFHENGDLGEALTSTEIVPELELGYIGIMPEVVPISPTPKPALADPDQEPENAAAGNGKEYKKIDGGRWHADILAAAVEGDGGSPYRRLRWCAESHLVAAATVAHGGPPVAASAAEGIERGRGSQETERDSIPDISEP